VHGVAENGAEAARLSLEAGTDIDMMSYLYLNEVPALIASGKLDRKYLDDAVRRVLRLKFDLGLFDNPYLYSDVNREKNEVRSLENLKTARDIAKRSIVLLKNDNQVLPIKEAVKSIAVIGPLAANKADMNGSWSFFGEVQHPVSILEGIQARAGKSIKVLHHDGCGLYDNSTEGFPAAVAVAKQADVVVMVVGESAVMNGEGASRADIKLPGIQEELVREIVATGKPTVVLLVNGRPLTVEWIHDNTDAILETWTLGSEAGHAVADVLFGDYNPSGKLPVTFPRNIGQVPIYYNHKNTGRPYSGDYTEPLDQRVYQSKYRDVKNSPLYPFGYGLSYTSFEYSDIALSDNKLDRSGKIEATVTVKNTGTVAGEEVVQLYIRDLVGSVTRPVKELKGFRKILLKAGESAKVNFIVTEEDLRFYRADMSWGSEPGKFEIYIGTNSQDVKKQSFELVEAISK
jgi:beta-glucosidase